LFWSLLIFLRNGAVLLFHFDLKDWCKMIIKAIALSLTYVAFLNPVLFAQDDLTVDKAHMVGVFQAHQANIENLRTGDVLIKLNITGNGVLEDFPPGPDSQSLISETSGYIRFIFDFDQNRFVVANRRKSIFNLYDALGDAIGGANRSADDSAGIYDKPKSVSLLRQSNGQIDDVLRITEDENRFLQAIKVPQFFGLGCSPFSTTDAWQPFSRVFQVMDQTNNVESIRILENVGKNRYRTESVLELKQSPAGGIRFESEWDVKRQVPVAFAYFAGVKADVEKVFSLRPITTCSVEWKELNGEVLPILGRGTNSGGIDVNGRTFGVHYEFEMKMHWFSINEPIPDETFDKEILRDVDKLSELVDGKWFEDEKK
jgi:hypothetical protein